MTDEEMAEEYAEKHSFRVPYDGSNKFYDDVDYKASKDGFLAGLKAGRPQWHDLKKDPKDLPIEPDILKNKPDNHRYEWFIVNDVGKSMSALYSFAKEKWFVDYEEMIIGANYFEPNVWCEIPQFKE